MYGNYVVLLVDRTYSDFYTALVGAACLITYDPVTSVATFYN